MQNKKVRVYTAFGQLDADIVRAFLESMQIHAVTSRESLGSVYGFSVGPLGAVDILVPEEEAASALEILRRMEAGEFENDSEVEDFQSGVKGTRE
jgi:type III secretory pathway lipoprotein EscJ